MIAGNKGKAFVVVYNYSFTSLQKKKRLDSFVK